MVKKRTLNSIACICEYVNVEKTSTMGTECKCRVKNKWRKVKFGSAIIIKEKKK